MSAPFFFGDELLVLRISFLLQLLDMVESFVDEAHLVREAAGVGVQGERQLLRELAERC